MFVAGTRVGVAVSGGADSVFLLEALAHLQASLGIGLHVLHVDHCLRADSKQDAAFSAAFAARHKLPFDLHVADVRAIAESEKENLEQAARRVRLDFFHRRIGAGVVDRVATGHTLSDQAETVLFRLLRGSGTAGLAGILPVTRDGLVRPLLAITSEEVRTYLRERGISWRVDQSNESLEFTRNRIRQELLPLLEAGYNPAIQTRLAQMADWARDEESYWGGEISKLFDDLAARKGCGWILDSRLLAELPPAVARRLIRHAIQAAKGDLLQIDFQHVERILALARSLEGHGRVVAAGVDVMRSFEWLRISPFEEEAVGRVQSAPLPVPGEAKLPGAAYRIRTKLSEGYNEEQIQQVLDWEKVSGPIQLRYWLPGDQYQPAGQQKPAKLKQMFQQERVPLWERRFWPIIEGSQGILWSRKFGPSIAQAPTKASPRVLLIEEIEENS
jgi:tRNA(Ile)-lysidine synthase